MDTYDISNGEMKDSNVMAGSWFKVKFVKCEITGGKFRSCVFENCKVNVTGHYSEFDGCKVKND